MHRNHLSFLAYRMLARNIDITGGGSSCTDGLRETLESDLRRSGSNYGAGIKQLGNELFVGETGAVGSIFSVGEVHYYTRASSAAAWTRHSGFHADTQLNGQQFGRAVDYDGTHVIVGANNSGSIGDCDTYTWSGSAWVHQQNINPNTYGLSGSAFGRGVALRGNNALIGAPNNDSLGTDRGGVEYWELDTGTWVIRQGFRSEDTNGVNGDKFGMGIAMTDDSTAYIAQFVSSSVTDIERWTKPGATWVFQDKWTLPYGTGDAAFIKMDTDGTNLIFGLDSWDDGGTSTNNYGKAVVTDLTGTVLVEIEGTVLTETLGAGVTIAGNEVVVGRPFADPSSVSNAGEADARDICP